MAARGHLELCPLAQNAGVFGRDVKAKSFIKGLKKSNQSSKHPSRRLVTELRILTLLCYSAFSIYLQNNSTNIIMFSI